MCHSKISFPDFKKIRFWETSVLKISWGSMHPYPPPPKMKWKPCSRNSVNSDNKKEGKKYLKLLHALYVLFYALSAGLLISKGRWRHPQADKRFWNSLGFSMLKSSLFWKFLVLQIIWCLISSLSSLSLECDIL